MKKVMQRQGLTDADGIPGSWGMHVETNPHLMSVLKFNFMVRCFEIPKNYVTNFSDLY